MSEQQATPPKPIDCLVVLAPLFAIPPVLAYVVGYLVSWSYLDGFGARWLVNELPTTYYLESSVRPLVIMGVAAIVTLAAWQIREEVSPRARKALTRISGGLVLLLAATYLIPDAPAFVAAIPYLAEALLIAWTTTTAALSKATYLRLRLGLGRLSLCTIAIWTVFGFIFTCTNYGRAQQIRRTDAPNLSWDWVVMKPTSDGTCALYRLLSAKDEKFFVLQGQTDSGQTTRYGDFEKLDVFVVKIVKAEDIDAIYPGGDPAVALAWKKAAESFEKAKELTKRAEENLKKLENKGNGTTLDKRASP